jgi:photosystem II stability/assembly factor-like uncharacterized protein
MQKPVRFFMIALMMGALAACNLPAASTITPTVSSEPANLTPSAQPATETAPPATATVETPPTASVPAPSDTPAGSPATGLAVPLYQINMLNTNDGWGWATGQGDTSQLLRTADGGQTWTDVTPQGQFTYYGSFFLNAQAAWLLFYNSGSNKGGAMRTTDGGKNWSTLPENDLLGNARLQFTSPDEGLAETAGVGAGNAYLNFYRTRDGGLSWEPVLITAPSPEPGLPPGTVHLCNICGDSLYYDPARAIIAYGDLASDPAGVVRLSISTDLGQSWKDLKLPLPDPKYADGLVAPIAPTFFGSEGVLPVNIIKYNTDGSLAFSVLVLYASHDGGQSWQADPALLENQDAQINSVEVLSEKIAIVRCNKNLCSTSDGAQSWQSLASSLDFSQAAAGPDYISQFSFVDPSNGWAISGESGATNLWKTTDGGASWTKLSPALVK